MERRGDPTGQMSKKLQAMAPGSQGRRGLLRGSGNTLHQEMDDKGLEGDSGCGESRYCAPESGSRA